MRRVSVVGIGAGDPEHLTVQAIRVLNEIDVVFMTDKGDQTSELVDARREICTRYIDDQDGYRLVVVPDPPRDRQSPAYREAVEDWRRDRARLYLELINSELGPDGHGAFLAWGDPALYDSIVPALDYALALEPNAFDVDVIPGISSVSALVARHGTTLSRTGRPVQVTTGRLLRAHGLPPDVDDVVVMLDSEAAFSDVDPDAYIYWGAYVGSEHELLMSGRLGEIADTIAKTKAEARAKHGWIMDSYLIRRSSP
ncbi:MAG TPA: precorrin-6A synthase (deacetylating) [Mycobacteriales bacterium]|nr:precorrin-6A synthase (deacetylating) [Mycobacteriales bacterium]